MRALGIDAVCWGIAITAAGFAPTVTAAYAVLVVVGPIIGWIGGHVGAR
jgi:hypothetical protein